MSIVVAFTILVIASCSPCLAQLSGTGKAIDIGSRRDLMVDDYLIDSLQARRTHRLHHPVRREIAVVHDEPGERKQGTDVGSLAGRLVRLRFVLREA